MPRTHPPVSAPALRHARWQLLDGRTPPAGAVREHLVHSWQRSMDAGLQPSGEHRHARHFAGIELAQARAGNRALIDHSQPVMEYLFEQVRHSHSIVVLADRHGVLMHTLGDTGFVSKAERVALTTGASWHEQDRGTNAIGTALAEAREVEIHGAEHYLERNDILTCAAAPIVSAQGDLLGVIDISGDRRSHHAHTLGLVHTAARMIENRLFTCAWSAPLQLHLHPRPHGIGTVAEGLVALSQDGWIVGANRQGLALLGLTHADLHVTPLAQVLDISMDALLAHSGQRTPMPLVVYCRNGRTLHALAQAGPPWTQTGQAYAAPAIPSPAPTLASDALAQLDTGDATWRAASDKARRVADKGIALLIQGESGVGKELFARAVHDSSQRRNRPFIAINCAAIPEHLIEAELFGYTAGAFSGASKQGSPGRLREAEGGTLFLDEIGDMPLALQTRLLRVLQERQVTPLGSGQAVPVDFALICATHQPLREATEAGRFRSDLYYRLNGLTVQLPPLRARSDFAALTTQLLRTLGAAPALAPTEALLARLAAYHWPGNLRQYANALRTALALHNPDEPHLDWQHLPDDLQADLQNPAVCGTAAQTAPQRPAAATRPIPLVGQTLANLSRAAMAQAVQDTQGNWSAAARQLGISRQTLYRKMAAL
ncbi:sigma-54-dependent Fis family transcriptional regulator [Simplicispira psychrophila]|uniref:sigma-54-dependent Fis family transcriptional regulator n=1 Tax=Simplicispira psychrophila TaxID=80882 RepID=UPI000568A1F8|nr:sigma-54-dependent Fis family transcriptional regulator [Simplicispira psychrophila]